MYVIMTYDVNVARVTKVLHIGRKYLYHVQRSVLEGELTEAQLRRLVSEVATVLNSEQDSVRFYLLRTTAYLAVQELGTGRHHSSSFV